MLMKCKTYLLLLLLFVLSTTVAYAENENSLWSLPDTLLLSNYSQRMDGAELTKVKDANFLNSLIGRMAGVTINPSASGIGGSLRFVMRGYRSILKSNNVLFTLDGIPLPRLESEQPSGIYEGAGQTGDGISAFSADDIESISVLSAAAASTLYGSRSSGGVVMINTKKAHAGKLRVELGNSTTFSSPLVMPEFQHDYGWGWGEKLNGPQSWNPADFYQTGHTINNSLSLSLGNEYNQTRVSAVTMNGAGIIPNNDVDRYNFSLRNTSSLLNDRLKLDVSLRYIHTAEQNMLSQGMISNPLIPIYLVPDVLQKQPNPAGAPSWSGLSTDYPYKDYYESYDSELGGNRQYWPFGYLGMDMQNPYWVINRNRYNQKKNRLLGGVGAKFDLTSWLNVAGRIHYDRNKEDGTQKFYASSIYRGPLGSFYQMENKNTQLYSDLLFNARGVMGDFSIEATLGASICNTEFDYSNEGGALAELNQFDISKLNKQEQFSSLKRDYHHLTRSLFMLAQLGYKNRLSLDLGGRMEWFKFWDDNSSRFSTDVFYPSVGVSVIPTGWLPDDAGAFLAFLKFHYAYSEAGNADYILLNKRPTLWSNPKVADTYQKPEHTKSHEVGMNASFLNDKVNLGFTLYKASTSNLKFGGYRYMPSIETTVYYISDGARIDNKGIELVLGTNLKWGEVGWNGRLTYSINKDEIKQLESNGNELYELKQIDIVRGSGWRSTLKKGGSLGDIYVSDLQRDGQGNIIVDKASQQVTGSNEYVYAGNTDPKYTMGWANRFSWKGLELDFVIHARFGGVGLSLTEAVMDQFGVSQATAMARDNGGVWVSGQQIPAENYYAQISGRNYVGSMYTYDATNIRLAEMSIAYHIPVKRWVNWIQDVRVALVGRNLLMLYNKAPFDPESTASTGTWYQGIDYFRQPSYRNMGFSLNLTF